MITFLGILAGSIYSACWVMSSRSVLWWVLMVINVLLVAVVRA